uniref:Type VI secretion system tube protein Hcp n=1 Tax=Amphora coffeiformis TaxID=265554 RepID=A0A7S3L1D1_9STRA|mmetsp:Transcript_15909/g.30039  ORF Transcript_15909/g.30039 Transcript_15909/m.30039 type:complete len:179 (+) Transcript_15909:208-744(+)
MKINIVSVVLLYLLSTTTVEAAVYMKIGDIKGESTDTDHKDWIDVLSVDWGILHQRTTGNARRRGSVIVEDINCTKKLDKSTPKLIEAVASGQVFTKAMVEFDRVVSDSTGGSRREVYYRYELTNVLVSSYSVSHSDGQPGTEVVSLSFEVIDGTYVENVRATGGNVETTWKVEKGTK